VLFIDQDDFGGDQRISRFNVLDRLRTDGRLMLPLRRDDAPGTARADAGYRARPVAAAAVAEIHQLVQRPDASALQSYRHDRPESHANRMSGSRAHNSERGRLLDQLLTNRREPPS
jgi:hypothetical protein